MTYEMELKHEACIKIIKLARECQELLGDKTVRFISEPTKAESLKDESEMRTQMIVRKMEDEDNQQ